jgi:hypothetical protein
VPAHTRELSRRSGAERGKCRSSSRNAVSAQMLSATPFAAGAASLIVVERRMGVAGAADILGRGAELERAGDLRDHGARPRSDHVGAEQAVGGRVRADFDEAFDVVVGARALALNGRFPSL